ncbi:hypothetical protein [Sediminicurvatus halobius]|uniref:hypothetical protein n=1 Tax=Sediminicurvatus halobius TaxID=2182432 RepID=UPI0011B1E2AD|nr:hypothetical protein [Spiribacter halobius]UEX79156.1 hypothetical protein LMH63_05800 [Spiribacter halobius]
MIYFSAKSDLAFLQGFKSDAETFLRAEGGEIRATDVNRINEEFVQHQQRRQRLARGTPRAKRIARSLGAPVDLVSYPAPAVGGPIVRVNTIDAILVNDGHERIPNKRILDALEQALGECQEQVRKEFLQLVNPLYWFSRVIRLILRLPFLALETAGFRPETFEKSLAGKFVRLIEILTMTAGLLYLGFTRVELKELVSRWLQ